MFFAREKEVLSLVFLHLDMVKKCLEAFTDALEEIFTSGTDVDIEKLSANVDKMESEADRTRHDIIKSMLKGALLPESRREILKLIEFADEVANKSEEAIRNIALQKIVFPDIIKSNILETSRIIKEQFAMLSKLIESLFVKYGALENYEEIRKIELLESEVDKLEEDAIRKIYGMDIELAEKNQLRDIISQISDISDIIEDTSDIIEIIMALKKV